MPAQIPDSIADWSTTAGSNQPSGSANVGPDLDDNLRAMQVAVRQTYTRGSIASAATCDIGTVDAELITVTGTTGISSLGTTLGATGYGVHKLLTFAGALTLTHSASLACITSANLTTAAGDSCMVEYGASGWTMLWYARKSGQNVAATTTFQDGTVSAPGIAFASDTNTGIYRIGADSMGLAAGGALVLKVAATECSITTAVDAAVNITTGGSSSSSHTASAINITAGSGTGVGDSGGHVSITSGGHGGNSGNAGRVILIASGATASGVAGDVWILSGGHENGACGDIELTAGGNSSPTNSGATGGNIIHRPGAGYRSGPVDTHGSHQFKNSNNQIGFELAGKNIHAQVVEMPGEIGSVSGAGTGATIRGTDNGYVITTGTSPTSTITVTFDEAWPNAPMAFVNYGTSNIACRVTTTTTTATISFASTPAASAAIHLFVLGWRD